MVQQVSRLTNLDQLAAADYENPKLPVHDRVPDLLTRMTLKGRNRSQNHVGAAGLEELEKWAMSQNYPVLQCGRQEMLENILNRYIQ